MSRVPSHKKFDGRLYTHYQHTHHTKSLAKKECTELRKQGYNCRVVEVPGGKGNYWSIYIRKSGRRKK